MKLYKPHGLLSAGYVVDHAEPATLEDLKAAAAEFGMVVVPREPTEEMIDAADDHFDGSIRQMYKAMIKAEG